ncbi:hypothetical protein J4410_03295 [Candidatus Woesearchaeota archaeon]|nr:hypothetical protein [Candidatus Woesearchaeota archaeon]
MNKKILFFLFFLFLPFVSASSGDVWIIDYQKGNGYLFDATGKLLYKDGHLTFPDKIVATREGGAWVLDKGEQQIVAYDSQARIITKIPVAVGVVDLAPYQEGVLIVDGSHGLILYLNQEGKEQQRWERFRIPSILEEARNGFWVGDADAVTKMNSSGEKQFSLPFKDVDVIAPTLDDGAWIADETTRSLTRVNAQGETLFVIDRYRRISDLAPLSDGGVFLLDKDSRKIVYLDAEGTEIHLINEIVLSNPKKISYDPATSTLWVIADTLVYQFKKTGEIILTLDEIPYPGDISVVQPSFVPLVVPSPKQTSPKKESIKKSPSLKKDVEETPEDKTEEKQEQAQENRTNTSLAPSLPTQQKDTSSFSWNTLSPYWIGLAALFILLIFFILLGVIKKK